MRIKRIAIIITTIALAGCTTKQPPAAPLQPALFTPVPPRPRHVEIPPDPLQTLSPQIRDAYIMNRQTPIRDGFATFYRYEPYTEPIVYCSPLHITEIVIGDGESIGAVAVGDSARWMVQPEHNRLLVKPIPNGGMSGMNNQVLGTPTQAATDMPKVYSTNLVIESNRRTYHLKLQARPRGAMETVAFWYPDDIQAAVDARQAAMHKAAREIADSPPAAQLNFAYQISGPNVAWKPIQAFDDGSHSYLLFADGAALKDDMPVLYVGQGKNQELVNYEVKGNYYIADRLYDDAALTQGTGTDRQTVRIQAMRAH